MDKEKPPTGRLFVLLTYAACNAEAQPSLPLEGKVTRR